MSRYQLCTFVLRFWITSAARGLNETGARPGGQLRHFWVPGVNGVDPPGVDLDGDAAERGHGVDGDQGAGLVGDPGDLLDGLPGAGGGLGVDDPDDLGADLLDGRADLLGVEDLAVRPFDRGDLGPGALGDVDHPAAEDAVDADEHLVARLDQVDDHGFHPRRAGAGDRHREPVLGLEDVPQQVLRLVHQGDELGVEVPEQRHPQRREDAGVDLARAGAEEQAAATGSAGRAVSGRRGAVTGSVLGRDGVVVGSDEGGRRSGRRRAP